jgi:hypothetical protein
VGRNPINFFSWGGGIVGSAEHISLTMDKLQLTGQNLGRVFYLRYGRVHAVHFLCLGVKLPNLKLKSRPKQVLGSFPLDIALPGLTLVSQQSMTKIIPTTVHLVTPKAGAKHELLFDKPASKLSLLDIEA